MAQPVVHFEIIGQDPARLRGYFGALFGWQFDTSGLVSETISQPDDYGFTEPGGDSGIPGGVGGGRDYDHRVIFYVGVPDVEAALRQAESLGGRRLLGPARAPSGLVIGHFADPEGNRIGLAAAG
jgi:predicted enzyme related to lactoylglutathione lyase